MPDLKNERRPRWVTEGDTSEAGGRKLNTDSTEDRGNQWETTPLDMLNLSRRDQFVWDQAYLSGYCHGHDAGRKFAEDEMAALHREAVKIVHGMAKLPERDREADKAWRARVEARWSK